MNSAEPISAEYWDRPVVTFWALRDKRLAPVGGGWLVHGAVLTAGHVLDAMNVLKEQGAEIYVGRCHREVCNVHGLFKFHPKLIARPSVSDLKRNPIAGDFALVEAPKNVAQLGLKVGRVRFSAVSNDVVSSGHYRLGFVSLGPPRSLVKSIQGLAFGLVSLSRVRQGFRCCLPPRNWSASTLEL